MPIVANRVVLNPCWWVVITNKLTCTNETCAVRRLSVLLVAHMRTAKRRYTPYATQRTAESPEH